MIYYYDAKTVKRILGLPCECNDPIPETIDGEIVIYYGGWELPTLRNSPAGKKHMRQQHNWYDEHELRAEPGYYRVLLRVPDSNRRNWNEQVSHLKTIGEGWQPTPITVAATALLVHLTETGSDLLQNGRCRCAEPLPNDHRVLLTVSGGHMRVSYDWDGYRYDSLWLAAARKY